MGLVGVVIFPPDYPPVTPGRMPLSLPQLLFRIGSRARYDLAGVVYPRWKFPPLQAEGEGPLGIRNTKCVVITTVVIVSFVTLRRTALTLIATARTGVLDIRTSQSSVGKGWSLGRDKLTG